MKSTFFFIVSLILFNIPPFYHLSTKITRSSLLEETLTDDELINFPLNELEGDCDTLQLFSSLLKTNILEKKADIDSLKTAITMIKDAKILVLKLLTIEKQLQTCEKSSNFLSKRQKLKEKQKNFSLKQGNFKGNIYFQLIDESKLVLSQFQDDFKDIIEKLNEIHDLVSEDCQKEIEDLNDFLSSVLEDGEDNKENHTENIEKYKEVIKLLTEVGQILKTIFESIENIKNELLLKKENAEVLMNDNDC